MRPALLLPVLASISSACNGNKALCGKKFSEVTFVGSHNSAFVGNGLSHNQERSVTEQLNMGVRYLQARTQNKKGNPQMCHSSCFLLDAGPLDKYLGEVNNWMNANPNEVVALLLTNIDNLPIEKFADAFKSTGLDKYVFRPKDKVVMDKWPTMQKLIDDGTRLVVFMDNHSDIKKVDYILDHFQYFWETPFGETDSKFPRCNIDRPNGSSPEGRMYMINHFLNIDLLLAKIPDRGNAAKTNSLESIDKQVNLCTGMWGRRPNVILLDWIDKGDAIEAQEKYNTGSNSTKRMRLARHRAP